MLAAANSASAMPSPGNICCHSADRKAGANVRYEQRGTDVGADRKGIESGVQLLRKHGLGRKAGKSVRETKTRAHGGKEPQGSGNTVSDARRERPSTLKKRRLGRLAGKGYSAFLLYFSKATCLVRALRPHPFSPTRSCAPPRERSTSGIQLFHSQQHACARKRVLSS